MNYEIMRVTRCALCVHLDYSEMFHMWFCAKHHHEADPGGACAWGTEPDDGDAPMTEGWRTR